MALVLPSQVSQSSQVASGGGGTRFRGLDVTGVSAMFETPVVVAGTSCPESPPESGVACTRGGWELLEYAPQACFVMLVPKEADLMKHFDYDEAGLPDGVKRQQGSHLFFELCEKARGCAKIPVHFKGPKFAGSGLKGGYDGFSASTGSHGATLDPSLDKNPNVYIEGTCEWSLSGGGLLAPSCPGKIRVGFMWHDLRNTDETVLPVIFYGASPEDIGPLRARAGVGCLHPEGIRSPMGGGRASLRARYTTSVTTVPQSQAEALRLVTATQAASGSGTVKVDKDSVGRRRRAAATELWGHDCANNMSLGETMEAESRAADTTLGLKFPGCIRASILGPASVILTFEEAIRRFHELKLAFPERFAVRRDTTMNILGTPTTQNTHHNRAATKAQADLDLRYPTGEHQEMVRIALLTCANLPRPLFPMDRFHAVMTAVRKKATIVDEPEFQYGADKRVIRCLLVQLTQAVIYWADEELFPPREVSDEDFCKWVPTNPIAASRVDVSGELPPQHLRQRAMLAAALEDLCKFGTYVFGAKTIELTNEDLPLHAVELVPLGSTTDEALSEDDPVVKSIDAEGVDQDRLMEEAESEDSASQHLPTLPGGEASLPAGENRYDPNDSFERSTPLLRPLGVVLKIRRLQASPDYLITLKLGPHHRHRQLRSVSCVVPSAAVSSPAPIPDSDYSAPRLLPNGFYHSVAGQYFTRRKAPMRYVYSRVDGRSRVCDGVEAQEGTFKSLKRSGDYSKMPYAEGVKRLVGNPKLPKGEYFSREAHGYMGHQLKLFDAKAAPTLAQAASERGSAASALEEDSTWARGGVASKLTPPEIKLARQLHTIIKRFKDRYKGSSVRPPKEEDIIRDSVSNVYEELRMQLQTRGGHLASTELLACAAQVEVVPAPVNPVAPHAAFALPSPALPPTSAQVSPSPFAADPPTLVPLFGVAPVVAPQPPLRPDPATPASLPAVDPPSRLALPPAPMGGGAAPPAPVIPVAPHAAFATMPHQLSSTRNEDLGRGLAPLLPAFEDIGNLKTHNFFNGLARCNWFFTAHGSSTPWGPPGSLNKVTALALRDAFIGWASRVEDAENWHVDLASLVLTPGPESNPRGERPEKRKASGRMGGRGGRGGRGRGRPAKGG
eukprot:CAMPEP_0118926002 /NCGR_PEP_ID=MMETSP1169-20130426/3797_1 /TAXON_ID=36882 /ORGANISM="Pyramimonas obovata, Strain CCMP722" /LENGTH=1126 /DNA_ID=CAMNT_0006867457 /DNA_START=385 /DNA_END=3766 /DNA_ORIENTATION=+